MIVILPHFFLLRPFKNLLYFDFLERHLGNLTRSEDAILPELAILAHHNHAALGPEHDSIRCEPHAGRYDDLDGVDKDYCLCTQIYCLINYLLQFNIFCPFVKLDRDAYVFSFTPAPLSPNCFLYVHYSKRVGSSNHD